MKSILITGGAGFIGANFIPYFHDKYPDYYLINLDNLTYAGDLTNLNEVATSKRYCFIKGEICDRTLLENIFVKYDIKGVVHFAAESHVDNSILDPGVFIQTNINGTFTLLDVARNYWMEKNSVPKKGYEEARFHHISTDEVYGTLGDTGLFCETTPYAPNSPYSASKASSDFLVRAYHNTYGMNVTTSNCSNNYGPKQHNEKFIPVIITKALTGANIPIYGNGKNIRDWLYVIDHCIGIDLVFHKGKKGESYNIGGRNEMSNLQIVNYVCKILDQKKPKENGSYKQQITFVADRMGHDQRYAIDATKIENELAWNAMENFQSGIIKTIDWFIK